MNNEIEIIDGVKGEWRTVTKSSEVKVGQRVRYEHDGSLYGYAGGSCSTRQVSENKLASTGSSFLFGANKNCEDVQAFFPLSVRKSRKVAKVEILDTTFIQYWITINGISLGSSYFMKRTNAVRSAKRFCKAIGYECEIQKEGK